MNDLNGKLQPNDSLLARPLIPTPYAFENQYPETQQRTNHTTDLFIAGTLVLPVDSGTTSLAIKGQVALQTSGGSALLVIRVGTINYTFIPSGTI